MPVEVDFPNIYFDRLIHPFVLVGTIQSIDGVRWDHHLPLVVVYQGIVIVSYDVKGYIP